MLKGRKRLGRRRGNAKAGERIDYEVRSAFVDVPNASKSPSMVKGCWRMGNGAESKIGNGMAFAKPIDRAVAIIRISTRKEWITTFSWSPMRVWLHYIRED